MQPSIFKVPCIFKRLCMFIQPSISIFENRLSLYNLVSLYNMKQNIVDIENNGKLHRFAAGSTIKNGFYIQEMGSTI